MKERRSLELTPNVLAGFVLFLLVYGVGILAFARWWYAPEPAVSQAQAKPSLNGQASESREALPGSETKPVADPPQAMPPANAPLAEGQSLRVRAQSAYAAGDYASAATYYEQALAQSPGDVELSNNLGLVLHYLGRTAQAIELLEAAAVDHPSHQRVWLTYGFVLANAGHEDRAREALLRARDLDPQSAIGAEATRILEPLWRG